MTRNKAFAVLLITLSVAVIGSIAPAQAASPRAAQVFSLPLEGDPLYIVTPDGETQEILTFVSGQMNVVIQQIPVPWEGTSFETLIIKSSLQNAVATDSTGAITCRLSGADQQDSRVSVIQGETFTFNLLSSTDTCPYSGSVEAFVPFRYSEGNATSLRVSGVRVVQPA
ncbi:hypothetical protein ARTSIC4J27_1846 [Pseudarthrobacter siccitolerans]|uniref:Uncharacterized protein n=1 Tax=Pseudarthrobacter siccitolerans TaxID=861266 RepID=A0A024H2C1_9MICC|nr:hypothetical protein [Pseudarthrobacter siccitolerans]CCQ45886.1 hypothetical protein ARTSIC4J27_1846 [Pseudarthrobacter siccitolerans]